MARYRKIDPRIWNDAKFSALSHEAQRAFFFVLTHPAMTALGAFRITREGMAAELGLAGKGFVEPFGELLGKGLVKYDESAFLLFVPNFLKYNPPENPNVIKSWEGSIDYLPECPLLAEVLAKASACAANTDAGSKAFAKTLGRVYETLFERYSKPLLKGMSKQEQEQEQEQEQKIERADALSAQAQAPASTPVRRRKTSGVSSVEKPDEIPEQVWSDWLQIRKAKRLPLTKTAWDAMLVEAEKVGFTPAEAVKHAVERGWASFKAQWVINEEEEQKNKRSSSKTNGLQEQFNNNPAYMEANGDWAFTE